VAGYRRGIRLSGAVVVVCGAAGAVGRATARALTDRGARPVLLDLPGPELDEAAREVGAPAFGLDVTDAPAVCDAARRAAERWGRIDGWVQCAGGTAAGGLLDLPPGQVRRLLEVDVLGAVNGARAAVPHLAAHGGGVLVAVVSVHGQVALPFGAPRSMAAAAVRAMAGALRQELRIDGSPGVAVTTVLAPDGAFPAGRPDRVAATVARRLRYPALETVAGGPVAKAVVHGHALVPPLTEWLVARRSRDR
jgi:NAD(P)-dependent dehydrogenase (short-subunit alcohol dehydrogenase family)